MTRVAMLIWGYRPGREGGAERQCRKIVEQGSGREIEFTVLTSRFSCSVAAKDSMAEGCIVRLGALTPFENRCRRLLERLLNLLPIGRIAGLRGGHWPQAALFFWLMLPVVWFSRLAFIVSLRNWFARNSESVDLLHVHEADWLAGVGAWLGSRHGIPVLAKTATTPAMPGMGYDTPLRGFWDRWRRRCRYIAQHEGLADELAAHGIARDHIIVLPNGVEIPENSAKPDQTGPVLYVGNFSQGTHWKAFDILIGAWSRVHRRLPGARLEMLGGGDASPWVRFAEEAGCRDSIRFRGMISDPRPYYENSCLFVLPSRVEGVSNALLEAQSFGLPCVVSDIPGNLAVVKDGVNGIVVPVGDSRRLADAILWLLENPELRNKFGRAAREQATGAFGLETVAEKLFDLYRSIAHRRSHP